MCRLKSTLNSRKTNSILVARQPLWQTCVTKLIRKNRQALELANIMLRFKKNVREDVLSCTLFTQNYPLMIDHMIREAQYYIDMLKKVQSNTKENPIAMAHGAEIFWDQIMMEHAEFVDGLLDPSETAHKQKAKGFVKQYATLEAQASQNILETTLQNSNATRSFRSFAAQATQEILQCKVRSLILPLLSDHVLREANYFFRLLKEAASGNQE